MKIEEASKISLFDHNKVAFDKVLNGWKSSNKVAVVHPTGTGKSYLILALMEYFASKKKIILAPTAVILEEFQLTYGNKLPNTILMTYATLTAKVRKGTNIPSFDYIIFDEFHRCGAKHWGSAVQLLLERNIAAKILGTSATPIRYLDNNRDMSDELFDGNVVSSMTLAEAIACGILPAPRYISALYTLHEELELVSSQINNSKREDINKQELISSLTNLKYQLENSLGIPTILKKHITTERKFVVFCSTLEHMNLMKGELQSWFKKAFPRKSIDIFEITYNTEDYKDELNSFRSSKADITLLFSVDILVEGLHVKDTDGVILLRPTISSRVYLQQIGRALSSFAEKQPLILDFVNNIKTALAKNLYDEVFRIRGNSSGGGRGKAKKLDKEFVLFDYVSDFEKELAKFSESFLVSWEYSYSLLKDFVDSFKRLPQHKEKHLRANVGRWLGYQRVLLGEGRISSDQIEKLNSLHSDWALTPDEVWDKKFSSFKDFVFEHDRFPELADDYNDFQVGSWFLRQLQMLKTGKLEHEKRNKLLSLDSNMGLLSDGFDYLWLKSFYALRDYIKTVGGKLKSTTSHRNIRVGSWYSSQYKLLLEGTLNDVQVSLLNSLHLKHAPQSNNDIWFKKFEIFKEFLALEKRQPKSEELFKGLDVGSWFSAQRTAFRTRKLPEDRLALLRSLGLALEAKPKRSWEFMFGLFSSYVKKTSKLPSKSTEYRGELLGSWFGYQKMAKKANNLDAEKETLLYSIHPNWNFDRVTELDSVWLQTYNLVSEFKRLNGVLPSSTDTLNKVNIGTWLVYQRVSLRKNKLSEERYSLLNLLDQNWWVDTRRKKG
jgi:superfamily II DNA or RNA helicase